MIPWTDGDREKEIDETRWRETWRRTGRRCWRIHLSSAEQMTGEWEYNSTIRPSADGRRQVEMTETTEP